jgi:hypothetical protein
MSMREALRKFTDRRQSFSKETIKTLSLDIFSMKILGIKQAIFGSLANAI